MSKYTKEQLQVMSDFEINKQLEILTGFYTEDVDLTYIKTMDYCNTPNDIMPLAFEHDISFDSGDLFSCQIAYSGLRFDEITGAVVGADFAYQDTNPLRAIACCRILVLQEENSQ